MALDSSKVVEDLGGGTNDKWAEAVGFFTGFKAPNRNDLFDSLVGNEGIPLMKVEISDVGYVDYVDTEDLNWLYENAGSDIKNTDFVIPFYHAKGGTGSDVTMHRARITLLGSKGDGRVPSQGWQEGGQFSSSIDGHLGMDGKPTWDTTPTARYAYGTGLALQELLNNDSQGTYGFSFNGKPVDDPDSVTLDNFEIVAAAFDRVAGFFSSQQKIVEEWQSRLGTEKDKAWRGKAAGVFWDLINKINQQYSDYADDMKPGGSSTGSKQGDEIRQAKKDFQNAVWDLHSVWAKWQWQYGNPLVVLHTLLSAIMKHVWDNNITKITYEIETHGSYGGGYTTTTNYISEEFFSNQAAIDAIEGKGDMALNVAAEDFGELKELDTWVKIGNKALLMWKQTVEENLDKAAVEAMTKVRDNWSNSQLDFGSVKSRGTSDTLESEYKEEKAELAEEKAEADAAKAEAAAEEAARKQEEFIQWQKDQAAKAEAERKKEKEEAERKEAEAKAEAERKEKEAKAEAERKEKEAKAEAEAKEKEAKAEQEAKEKEAEAKAAEQEAKAEAKEAEAKAEQEAKEKEAEAKAAEQEAKAEAKEAEARAEQEAKEKEAEQKQAEQEAKQEQLRAEQEAKQEQVRKEQEAKQAEAQARAENMQMMQMNQAKTQQEEAKKEQEAKEAQARAEQEAKEAEARAEQEAKEKEAEQKQAEQEAKQEAKEAEARAEQEAKEKEAEQKQAEAEQKQDRIRTEQEERQEQQQAEQEQKQAEAEAKAEQKQAEQEAKQEAKEAEARAEQEAKEKEAEQKQGRGRAEAGPHPRGAGSQAGPAARGAGSQAGRGPRRAGGPAEGGRGQAGRGPRRAGGPAEGGRGQAGRGPRRAGSPAEGGRGQAGGSPAGAGAPAGRGRVQARRLPAGPLRERRHSRPVIHPHHRPGQRRPARTPRRR
ncbi:AAWKG family protein [Streptomyces sp. NE06-03C]|uniref:AAWKG family protein n=1 Tax=Streptomyces sp. NE06-03C TaxID=3028694 RepID=UPI0029B59091|nr:AAWKG family protein [Streptomyces sp. NE06-03C]MDX2920054.1 AAWKG family protein [Streptomyces sp. NE06-03C]